MRLIGIIPTLIKLLSIKYNLLKALSLMGLAWFYILMIRITLQYIPIGSDVAFLGIKQTEVTQVPGYLPIFYTHVCTAIFVLLAGFTQFNQGILKNRKRLHRIGGYFYLIVVLLFAAPSGIFIGFHANGGPFAIVSFVLLGVFWFFYTAYGGYLPSKENTNFTGIICTGVMPLQ